MVRGSGEKTGLELDVACQWRLLQADASLPSRFCKGLRSGDNRKFDFMAYREKRTLGERPLCRLSRTNPSMRPRITRRRLGSARASSWSCRERGGGSWGKEKGREERLSESANHSPSMTPLHRSRSCRSGCLTSRLLGCMLVTCEL